TANPTMGAPRLDDNDTLAFTAEVDVAPKLELPALDDLAVTVDDVEVSDAEIDEQVDVMRERFAMLTGVERAAEDGDFVSIDLEAKLDGEVLEDGTTSGMSYEVGSGQLMEGLDDAVRGLSADGSATFQTALLSGPNAGEMADVTVTVRSVKEKELPELDDEFASTASEFDPLAGLREDVRTRLARTKVLQQGAQARDKLVEHLLETVEVPVPENLVEREVEWRNQAMERELQQAGMDWDSFLQMSGVEGGREEYAQQLQQGGNIAEFVADVRRTKTLAQLLEQTTITDASGNVVDLEALRPRTVQAPAADDADEADTEDADQADTEDAEEAPDAEVAEEAPDAEVADAA